jgi:hypothetical protein
VTLGQRYEALSVLMDFSRINRADTTPSDFFSVVRQKLVKGFLFSSVEVFLQDPRSDVFRSVFGAGKKIPSEQILPEKGQWYLTGVSMPSGDIHMDDWLVPLRSSEHRVAVVALRLPEGRVTFPPDEIRLLEGFFRQCEIALENVLLYQDLNQKANRIEQLRQFNENVIESSKVGIAVFDENRQLVFWNRSFQELLGHDGETVIYGKRWEELFWSVEAEAQEPLPRGSYETQLVNLSGQTVEVEVKKTPMLAEDLEVYGTLVLIEDISEKKQLQEQLIQQEKLASIGLLAAGVAHEINTPLTGILSYLQFLQQGQELTEDQEELVALISQQAKRAGHIVGELLQFSRKDEHEMMALPVDEVVAKTLSLIDHQLRRGHIQIIHEPNGEATVWGSENKLQQVFLNLFLNALDAMPEGGSLRIRSNVSAKDVHVLVEDTGVGMPDHVVKKALDPFFTTKEVGKGTGLGLSVVYNILRDHQADVRLHSKANRGTTVSLHFPKPDQAKGKKTLRRNA